MPRALASLNWKRWRRACRSSIHRLTRLFRAWRAMASRRSPFHPAIMPGWRKPSKHCSAIRSGAGAWAMPAGFAPPRNTPPTPSGKESKRSIAMPWPSGHQAGRPWLHAPEPSLRVRKIGIAETDRRHVSGDPRQSLVREEQLMYSQSIPRVEMEWEELTRDLDARFAPRLGPRRTPPLRAPSRGRRMFRSLTRFSMTTLIGIAATLAWQSHGDAARDVVVAQAPSLGWLL